MIEFLSQKNLKNLKDSAWQIANRGYNAYALKWGIGITMFINPTITANSQATTAREASRIVVRQPQESYNNGGEP